MIGIVGPRDSVALAQRVATELRRGDELIGVPYRNTDEAIDLARSIEASCDVLLFTGQVPYQAARHAGTWRRELQVISHSGADLYRMIGLALKECRGEFPRVSVDALESETVAEVFRDMGFPVPEVIVPVIDGSEFVFEGPKATAQAHRRAIAAGQAEAALTCLAETYAILRRAGVRTWRIEHARVTIAEALQRAWLTGEVARTKGNSPAVAIIEAAQDVRLPARRLANAQAEFGRALATHGRRMSAHIAIEDDRYVLTTTQAAVEQMVERHLRDHKSLLDVVSHPVSGLQITLGIGVGSTFATAHDAAGKALRVASAGDGSGPTIAYEDGTVRFVDSQPKQWAVTSLQETSGEVLDLAQRTGLGPLSLRRLVDAVSRADATAITAQQLAEYYGVMPRSARRMLAALVAAGYAHEAGVRAAVGAGRPHVVYEVDLWRLRASLVGVGER